MLGRNGQGREGIVAALGLFKQFDDPLVVALRLVPGIVGILRVVGVWHHKLDVIKQRSAREPVLSQPFCNHDLHFGFGEGFQLRREDQITHSGTFSASVAP